MSRITAFVTALAFAASATVASAGGLAAPEEENDVIVVGAGADPAPGLNGAVIGGVAASALLLALALKNNNSGSH